MPRTSRRFPSLSLLLCALASVAASPAVIAQGYPRVPKEIQAAADARKLAADRRSDEIFARQLPEIQAWASRGKPYLPGAALPKDLPQASIPAFPGAEGGGMYTFGGRGGKVMVVTTLKDDGPGSFREACEAAGPRIVVFNVAGIIQLRDRIRIRAPYITIAGNTAPGDGVCIAGNTVELETHDIIVRHMRFRRGSTDATDRNDSFGGNPVGNLMIDHVSASWGLDENMSMYRHMYQPPQGGPDLKLPTVNVTIQNSIFSEALNTYHHAFGSTIGGLNSTFLRNVWASNTGRNPSVGMYGDFTLANNVIFNYRHRTVDGGDHRSQYNIINNYFKPGPGTPDSAVRHRLLKPESERSKVVIDNFGQAFVSGNIVEGNDRVTKDNWDGGVQPDVREKPLKAVLAAIRVDRPFSHAPFTLHPAKVAFDLVLANAGATLPRRDAVDARVTTMVRTGVVAKTVAKPEDLAKAAAVGYAPKWIHELEVGVTKGFITEPSQVGGYPNYQGTPYVDSDRDGMSDSWETAHGLNPRDASDASGDLNRDGYTNIEDFINGLDPRAPAIDWTDLKNNVDRRSATITASTDR